MVRPWLYHSNEPWFMHCYRTMVEPWLYHGNEPWFMHCYRTMVEPWLYHGNEPWFMHGCRTMVHLPWYNHGRAMVPYYGRFPTPRHRRQCANKLRSAIVTPHPAFYTHPARQDFSWSRV